MLKIFDKLKHYIHLTDTGQLGQRYFVIGAFDGALTVLGMILASYFTGSLSPSFIIPAAIGATMVSISVRWIDGAQPDTHEALQQYIVEEDIAWWVVLDTAKAVSQNESATSSATEAYGIQATPTTVLIDQAGQIVFNQVGAISLATLKAQIQQLLG